MKIKTSELTGAVFDSLTVLSRSGSSEDGRRQWRCLCTCGKEVLATTKQLTTKRTRACSDCQDSGSRSTLQVRLKKYKVANDGCWNWTGKLNQHGYGVITVDGRNTRAHRAMHFMLRPNADKSLVVMHTCDNPRCVNPQHLKLGTQKENMADMHAKGRFRGGAPSGNKNAAGNKGWQRGGATAKYFTPKLGDEVDVPEELLK
jgi:hypothetical protein